MKLTNRSKVVSNKEMTFMERIYLPEIMKGMAITLKHALAGSKGKVYSYPEVEKPRAKVWRGLHVLKRDEEGRERCTACGLCAVACPAEAITMTAAERTETKKTCTAKKNTQQYTKLICCDVFSVACAKKLAPNLRFT